jgi:hypothetical protein
MLPEQKSRLAPQRQRVNANRKRLDHRLIMCIPATAVVEHDTVGLCMARWYERALVENPAAVWLNNTLAPAYALAGHKEHAERSVTEIARAFPDLTIGQRARAIG